VADGGFAAHWGGLLYDTKSAGRTFVADRGFASIGYGLPGAMGSAMGQTDSEVPVVALTGDGGFNMVLGELETALRLGLNFVVIVLNNAASGYVKALQHAVYDGKYQSSDLTEIDYAKLAKNLGCWSVRVERPEQLSAAIHEALAHRGSPFVLDVQVTRDPSKMLPAADNRTLVVKKGDRPV
jgi:acetolactate synthase-1/2/3 large subunit